MKKYLYLLLIFTAVLIIVFIIGKFGTNNQGSSQQSLREQVESAVNEEEREQIVKELLEQCEKYENQELPYPVKEVPDEPLTSAFPSDTEIPNKLSWDNMDIELWQPDEPVSLVLSIPLPEDYRAAFSLGREEGAYRLKDILFADLRENKRKVNVKTEQAEQADIRSFNRLECEVVFLNYSLNQLPKKNSGSIIWKPNEQLLQVLLKSDQEEEFSFLYDKKSGSIMKYSENLAEEDAVKIGNEAYLFTQELLNESGFLQ